MHTAVWKWPMVATRVPGTEASSPSYLPCSLLMHTECSATILVTQSLLAKSQAPAPLLVPILSLQGYVPSSSF